MPAANTISTPRDFDLKPGSRVVVETDRGRALAIVVTAPREIPDEQAPEGLKGILRLATDDDLAHGGRQRRPREGGHRATARSGSSHATWR